MLFPLARLIKVGKKMKFKILGIPKAKQSFRYTKSGIRYQPKEVKQTEKDIRQQIIEQLPKDFKPMTGGIWITKLHFVFPAIAGLSKKKKELVESEKLPKVTAPDLENLQKGLNDALEGVVFIRDSQICFLNDVKKLYGTVPRIEIDLEEI